MDPPLNPPVRRANWRCLGCVVCYCGLAAGRRAGVSRWAAEKVGWVVATMERPHVPPRPAMVRWACRADGFPMDLGTSELSAQIDDIPCHPVPLSRPAASSVDYHPVPPRA